MSKKADKTMIFDFKTFDFGQKSAKMSKTTANVAEARNFLSRVFHTNLACLLELK
jgi:hypothetical protein